MDWKQWKQWYYKIIADFGYDPQKDRDSALILNDFLRNKKGIAHLKQLIEKNIIFIYGCGPSLPYHLKLLRDSSLHLEEFIHIAADGATSALLEYNIIPQIILSDLDGRISDLITANKKGSVIIIHAHGDNMDTIKRYVPLFPGEIMGTTQNKPFSSLKNYGGFTDGDRGVYFAEAMGGLQIILFGFDFGNIIGKFSKPYLEHDELATELKLKKLQWAQILITELSLHTKARIIKINGQKVKLGKVTNCEFENLLKLLTTPQNLVDF